MATSPVATPAGLQDILLPSTPERSPCTWLHRCRFRWPASLLSATTCGRTFAASHGPTRPRPPARTYHAPGRTYAAPGDQPHCCPPPPAATTPGRTSAAPGCQPTRRPPLSRAFAPGHVAASLGGPASLATSPLPLARPTAVHHQAWPTRPATSPLAVVCLPGGYPAWPT